MIKIDINWPKNQEEGRKLQEQHKNKVQIIAYGKEPEYVAGVDAAFSADRVFAAACLYRYPELGLIEQSFYVTKATFPYIPGYLLFLEGPAIISALKRLKRVPDLLLIDGQGIAHPRGIGSASHLGLLLDIPAIGCAKTGLVGEFEQPGMQKGKSSAIIYEGRTVGAVLRTKNNVKPLFVSPGHKIDLHDAVRITLACVREYRIPEPLRCADILSRKLKAGRVQNSVG